MCCSTKEKIAAAVKSLMRQKSIRKITVQDIMDETGMKRQSFYYHFQDIYDVIEWICQRELISKIDMDQENSFEEWFRTLMEAIETDRSFYRKLANELEWRMVAQRAKGPIAEQVRLFFAKDPDLQETSPVEEEFLVDFFSTSIIYYLLDFVSSQKNMSEEERSRQIALIVRTLGKYHIDEGMAVANA